MPEELHRAALPQHPSTQAPPRLPRKDGQASRQRIVDAALRLFAEQGFEKTSTRQIAQAAGVNIAAIHYHFGDKAGLYRVAFVEPLGPEFKHCDDVGFLDDAAVPLPDAMQRLFADFLGPLALGDEMKLVMRLHYREMVEPTGVWQEEIEKEIKPMQAALVRRLTRELGRRRPDADVERLAFALIGMAVHFFVAREVVDSIAPQLLRDAKAVTALADRLALYACDMVHGEARRRRAAAAAEKRKART
jgi:TetR/AcrR family transcriptional regulator, regulator of cefoperazone and chloramphenicol sensitivity